MFDFNGGTKLNEFWQSLKADLKSLLDRVVKLEDSVEDATAITTDNVFTIDDKENVSGGGGNVSTGASKSLSIGVASSVSGQENVAIGGATASYGSVAIGQGANANSGVSIGNRATSTMGGIAIGDETSAAPSSIAIGTSNMVPNAKSFGYGGISEHTIVASASLPAYGTNAELLVYNSSRLAIKLTAKMSIKLKYYWWRTDSANTCGSGEVLINIGGGLCSWKEIMTLNSPPTTGITNLPKVVNIVLTNTTSSGSQLTITMSGLTSYATTVKAVLDVTSWG